MDFDELTGAVPDHAEPFDWQTFLDRVSDIEHADLRQLRHQLPADESWPKLFAVVDAGG